MFKCHLAFNTFFTYYNVDGLHLLGTVCDAADRPAQQVNSSGVVN